MNNKRNSNNKSVLTNLYTYVIIICCIWTAIIVFFLMSNIYREKDTTRDLAISIERANFTKDMAFRLWSSSHGGVYVPSDKRTPPNPNLKHIPERDIITPSGKKLTLMNPAYMIRQWMNEYPGLYGIKGKITSLKAIFPGNTPDDWERSALQDFEKGKKEVFEFVSINNNPTLRLIRPLITTKKCLKCHSIHGYKEGDIRGGISTSLSLKPIYAIQHKHITLLYITHALIFFLGLIGIVIGAQRIKRNISIRIISEEEKIKEIEFTNAAINAQIDTFVVFDPSNGKPYRWNRSFQEISGYSNEQISKMKVPDDWFSNEDVKRIENFMKNLIKGEKVILELSLICNDGRKVPTEYSSSIIEDESGKPKFIIAIGRDITERKKIEKSLIESEHYLKEAQILAHIGYWKLDVETQGVIGSDELFRIFGLSHEEANLDSFVEVVHPDDRENDVNLIRRGMEHGESWDFEHRLICKDNTEKVVHTKGEAVKDKNGKVLYLMGTVQDVTERKKNEEIIKIALQEKETLLRELYHRTKNNMQVISSILSMQSSISENDVVTRIFTDMQNRIQSMSLVHQKLYQSMDLSNINLKEYIYELSELLVVSYNISPEKVSLELDTEDIFVLIDFAIPCGLVLNELISNSLKFAFPGEKKGKLVIVLRRTDDGEIEFQVSDNGIGVPDDFDFREQKTLGIQTSIAIIEHQLRGKIEFKNDNGLKCKINFNDTLYKKRV